MIITVLQKTLKGIRGERLGNCEILRLTTTKYFMYFIFMSKYIYTKNFKFFALSMF